MEGVRILTVLVEYAGCGCFLLYIMPMHMLVLVNMCIDINACKKYVTIINQYCHSYFVLVEQDSRAQARWEHITHSVYITMVGREQLPATIVISMNKSLGSTRRPFYGSASKNILREATRDIDMLGTEGPYRQ